MDDYKQLLVDLKTEFPKFRVVSKTESAFMRFLSFLARVFTFGSQRTFMTDYTTTVGTTVYVPEGWDSWSDERRIPVLRHERIHMRQVKKWSIPIFYLLYLFLPLPLGLAWFRARFEWEAYEETMRAQADRHGSRLLEDERFRDAIVRNFTTGAYGWMWPFEKKIVEWYGASKARILAERAK